MIKGGNAAKIQEFYGKLLISVQALESIGKLGEIKGQGRAAVDKLEGVRADFVDFVHKQTDIQTQQSFICFKRI